MDNETCYLRNLSVTVEILIILCCTCRVSKLRMIKMLLPWLRGSPMSCELIPSKGTKIELIEISFSLIFN